MSGRIVVDVGTGRLISTVEVNKRVSDSTKFLEWMRSKKDIHLKQMDEKKELMIQDKNDTLILLGTSFGLIFSPRLLNMARSVKRRLTAFLIERMTHIVMNDVKVGTAGSLFADITTNDKALPPKLRVALCGLQNDDGKLTHQIPFKTDGVILYLRIDIPSLYLQKTSLLHEQVI
jgi:hypothetical protein